MPISASLIQSLRTPKDGPVFCVIQTAVQMELNVQGQVYPRRIGRKPDICFPKESLGIQQSKSDVQFQSDTPWPPPLALSALMPLYLYHTHSLQVALSNLGG